MDVSQHVERDDRNISRFMRLKCKEWKDIVNWERKERIYLRVNENILTFTRILNEDKTKNNRENPIFYRFLLISNKLGYNKNHVRIQWIYNNKKRVSSIHRDLIWFKFDFFYLLRWMLNNC